MVARGNGSLEVRKEVKGWSASRRMVAAVRGANSQHVVLLLRSSFHSCIARSAPPFGF